MPRPRPVDFRVLREMIGPRDVLRLIAWRPVWERGELARGPCPIHRSSSTQSRSLTVSIEVVYCHKCHWSGDAVAIWAKLKGLPMLDAAHDLCRELRITPPFLT